MNLRLVPAAFAPVALFYFAAPLAGAQAVSSNYRIDYWNTENGLPQNSVNHVLQSRDGYLWLATLGGAARFDGTTFTAITTGDYGGLRSDRVRAVVDDRAGRIWIGTENGLSRFEHGRVTTFGVAEGMPGDEVNALAASPDGSVWFGTGNGAVGRADANGVHTLIPALAQLGNSVEDILIDESRAVWVSARTGVWKFDAARPTIAPVQVFAIGARGSAEPRPARIAVDREPTHGLWIVGDSGLVHVTPAATRRVSLDPRTGLNTHRGMSIATSGPNVIWLAARDTLWRYRADSGSVERIDDLHVQSIFSLFADREGGVWIGDRIVGLARVRPTLFRAFTQADGLPQDNVVSAFADSHDRVWVAGRCSGAGLYDGKRFQRLLGKATGDCLETFAEDARGDIWIGGDHLTRWRDGQVIARYDSTTGLPRGPIRSVVRDAQGTLWIGSLGGLVSWDGTRFTVHEIPTGVGLRSIRVILPARDGSLWLGSEGGLLHYAKGAVQPLTVADGLPNNFVRALLEDSTGLWIATYGGGLARLRNGRVQSFTTRDGLFDNYLSSIADDGRGNLWFSSNRGVFRVTRTELERYAATRRERLHTIAYGRADGMPSAEANGGFQWGVARTRDGRLWYPTVGGLAVVDPAKTGGMVAPSVTLERVVIDGKPQDSTNALRLGPDVSAVEISYAGLSLSTPNGISFRYRLEPWDRDWIDAGTRRTATYSRLPHGEYRFRVMAANREGTWAADTATLSFTILPHFWQTWWFRILAALGLTGAGSAAVALRVRQVRAATATAERTAAQRREALILESITDGFFALDRDGRFTYVNHTAERVLARVAAGLVGARFVDAVPALRETIAERELQRAQSERVPVTFEAPDTPTPGTWLEVHAYPTDEGLSVYFADVTSRKQAEEELRSQKEEIEAQAEELAQQTDELARQNEILEENVRLKDEVERISRHDLRTPLNTIISLSQIAREDAALAPEHETSLRLIEQAGYRVLHMASLTLDLFKMEQGTYVLEARPLDVRGVVDRALADLEPLMRTRHVTAAVTTSGDARPFSTGDELLAQAMTSNVIKNAVEASPSGGRVTIDIASGARVQLRVHNEGEIPADIRRRFFEKYATSGKKGGTGLGAYSARLMARTQGGDITVESSADRGTTVTIDLPRSANGGAPRAAAAPARATPSHDNYPPRRILIVDDDAGNRAILRRFLAAPGWTVDDAENGPLGVNLAAEHQYDVIFMDIEMPVMDGFEATARIRAGEHAGHDASRARIIAFSSHDDEPTRERAFQAGCDRYLVKPATRQAIVDIVLGVEPVPASVATLDPAIRDLVPAFLERKRSEVSELVAAVTTRDVEASRRISHRLRGSFSVYGFSEASAMCEQIETAARAGSLGAGADKLVLALYDHLRAMDAGSAPEGTLKQET